MRGGNLTLDTMRWPCSGASPRARGKLDARHHALAMLRCIPACAGETTLRARLRRTRRVASPRARGKPCQDSGGDRHLGYIPAHGGASRMARSVGARAGHEGPGSHSGPSLRAESAPYATRTRCPSPAPRLWTPPLPWTQRARPPELAKPRRRGFAQRPQLHCCCWYFNLNELNDGPEDRQVSRFAQFFVTADRARRRSGHGRRARGRSAARSSNRGRYGRSENRKAKTAPTIQKGRSGRNRSQDHPEDTERGTTCRLRL